MLMCSLYCYKSRSTAAFIRRCIQELFAFQNSMNVRVVSQVRGQHSTNVYVTLDGNTSIT